MTEYGQTAARPVFTEDAEWLGPAGNATAVALAGPSHMIGRPAIAHFLAEDFARLFVRDASVTFTDGLIHRVREYMDTARGHRMIFG
jgi:hypothetical protein